jgi:predicted glycoside hydrolase/deacetylase ChbG (UPF0249 family)
MHAHLHGIVTSASLMVRWPAAVQAAQYAREDPTLSVGLHLDLGEWIYRDWNWIPRYQVVLPDDGAAIHRELLTQLSLFRDLVGREPSHIDSHQHVHMKEPALSLVIEEARRLGIPVRDCSSHVRHCGKFYGATKEGLPYPAGITAESLIQIGSQMEPGFTELGCHPGFTADGEEPDPMYAEQRADEVKTLCDPRVRLAFEEMGIHFCSFADCKEMGLART